MPPATMVPTAASAYASLQDAQKNAVTPDAAISAGDTKYGVSGLSSQLDQLRGLTSNLNTSLANVDPSVRGRTSGSLVTEAQRQAITNNESQPIVDEINKTGQQATDVGQQYQNATGLASNYANSLLTSDKNKYDELFGQYTTLSGQEADAAKEVEAKREFDANLEATKAATAAASSAGLSLGGDSNTATTTPAAVPQYTKGTTPQTAVADLFQGYQPGAKPYYTENVVIPAIERLLALNNPKSPPNIINAAANSLVYSYRHSTFGE